MINVLACTSGKNVPSSRFRVRQHILPLKKEGINVTEDFTRNEKLDNPPQLLWKFLPRLGLNTIESWNKIRIPLRSPVRLLSNFFDIVWLERFLINGTLSYELKIKKPVVFDMDDAIWLNGGNDTYKIAGHSAMIFAGNNFLAEWCRQYNKNVHVIPTAVNIDPSSKVYMPGTRKEKVIGWIGTSSNFPNFAAILKPLATVLKNKNISLLICADKDPEFKEFDYNFMLWSPAREKIFFEGIDLGIMPLLDTEWNRGKCSYKMLQYLGNGIPALVSPVGMNKEISDQLGIDITAADADEWLYKATTTLSDLDIANNISIRGKHLIQEKYSTDVISQKIANLFKTI